MKVFISSLGVMGRRHFSGALLAAAEIIAFDPSDASIEKARETLHKPEFKDAKVEFVKSLPVGKEYDVAIFSETADYRKDNFLNFLETNKVKRVLLEKPIVRSEKDLAEIFSRCKELIASGVTVNVNFPRRSWPFYQALKNELKNEKFIEMTLNGGAVGLGCNGIHYLDTFSFLTSESAEPLKILFSQVTDVLVGSGRGERFKDYGGKFLVAKGSNSFFLTINPESTATPILTIKGNNKTLWIDENNYTYRKWTKEAGFEKPNYLYGQDYKITSEGSVEYRDLISLTKGWLQGEISLPTLAEAQESHLALFELLKSAKVQEPYLFT
ncbi:hypothetical protein [Bdellovibrio sp. HCB-110]|uniref:hypothetical protein n=1 Tax=Bdellovibrio sp. HCB-110 TaxID=3391182 RepID=UPI0039B6A1F4